MCILKGYVRREGGRSSEDSGDLERPNARSRWHPSFKTERTDNGTETMETHGG